MLFRSFYAKLNDIVNSAYNLDEIYDQPKIVRKILRSLIENFRPKMTADNAWMISGLKLYDTAKGC